MKNQRINRINFANFVQVATRSQAEHGAMFHLELSRRLAKGYPELSRIEAKIAECFEARVYDICRGVRDDCLL